MLLLFTERDCEIIQISAWCGARSFTKYVKPTIPINAAASKVNKMEMIEGELHHYGQKVISVDRQEALNEFVEFIQSLACDDDGVVLVAHNGRSFDFPR